MQLTSCRVNRYLCLVRRSIELNALLADNSCKWHNGYMLKIKRSKVAIFLLAMGLVVAPFVVMKRNEIRFWIKNLPVIRSYSQRKTVEDQMQIYAAPVRSRLQPLFSERKIDYPPVKLIMVAVKGTGELQVYVADKNGPFVFVRSYPIVAASGILGPKLRSGDCQVPEGVYRLTPEPNTPYHLALRLNYPNEMDLARAKTDGRTNPGSDILVHGSDGSVGCLAMGDPTSEDLFVLACDTADRDIPLIICPVDFRKHEPPEIEDAPRWLPDLYAEIRRALLPLPLPN